MKSAFIGLILLMSSSAFAAQRLSGGDAQTMFDALQRAGFQVISVATGEDLVSAFNITCANDLCMADTNFVDPALNRKEMTAKDSAVVKALLLKSGFKPVVSSASNSNGVIFIGGANVSCTVTIPNGFKQCAFE